MATLNLVPYYDLSEDYEGIGRHYSTPDGHRYPSITTILGRQPKPGLDKWRERIGDDEADRKMKASAKVGTEFHDACERYVRGQDSEVLTPGAQMLFTQARSQLKLIDNVVGLEIPMWSNYLKVAGRSDCIAEWTPIKELAIIDYKNSRSPKGKEWCSDYFKQGAAYSRMFYELYGITIKKIVIIIAVWGAPKPTVYVEDVKDWIGPCIDVMKKHNPMWN